MNWSLQLQMQSEINRLSAEVSSVKDACQLEVNTKTELAAAMLTMLHLGVISFPRIRYQRSLLSV